MQITSGRVVFSRTVQPAQYESARGECELSFIIEEGEELDAVIDEVSAIVKEKALALVGRRKATGT